MQTAGAGTSWEPVAGEPSGLGVATATASTANGQARKDSASPHASMVTILGGNVTASRTSSSDGILCEYTGVSGGPNLSGAPASPNPTGSPFPVERSGATGQALDTIVVEAKNPNPVRSNVVLEAGKPYLIQATGVFSYGGGVYGEDAVWGFIQDGASRFWNPLLIDGRGMSEWAGREIPYNDDHVYTVPFVGKGAPVALLIMHAGDLPENRGDPPRYHRRKSNSGALTVRIYEGERSGVGIVAGGTSSGSTTTASGPTTTTVIPTATTAGAVQPPSGGRGPFVETVRIPGDQRQKWTMQTVLDAGQWYEIEAAGTFDAWGTTPHGIDAVWCFKPGRCNTPQPWQQLRVDNQGFEDFAKKWMGESFELPYKRNHLYSIRVQGEGRPLTFHLWDAIEQNSAGGNLGSLTVRVYRIGGGTPTGISGGGRYTRIPKTAIPGHNIQSLSNVTVADCERACDQRSDCLTFDYTRGGTTCYVQNTADGAVSSNSYDHYIKPGVRTAVAGTSTGPDRLGTRWDEEEVAGWKGVWTRRGNTNVFDARWERPGSTAATAVLTIELNGNTVRIERRHDNGQGCTYTGTLAPDGVTVSGKYGCDSAPGPFDWKATISRGSGGSASTGPASAASPSPAGGPVRGVRRGDTEQALDMIVVQANNPTPVRSNVVLQTGKRYFIQAMGVFSVWGGRSDGVDAVWCYHETRCRNRAVWNQLLIDGRGMSEWAGREIPYSDDHVYTVPFVERERLSSS